MALIQLTLKSTDTDKTQIKKNKENYEKKNRRRGGISGISWLVLKLSQRLRLAESRWELEIEKQKKSFASSPTSKKPDSFKKRLRSIWEEGRVASSPTSQKPDSFIKKASVYVFCTINLSQILYWYILPLCYTQSTADCSRSVAGEIIYFRLFEKRWTVSKDGFGLIIWEEDLDLLYLGLKSGL